MAQKVLTVILALLVVGGLAWYINKNYVQPSENKNPGFLPKYKSSIPSKRASLFYVTTENVKEIWQVDPSEGKEVIAKKVFTDADETEKIIQMTNLAHFTGEVLAITNSSTEAISGNLVSIDLENAKSEVILKSFSLPSAWGLSDDGKKLAYVRFSNLEDNYGYTLYTQERDGSNVREIIRSESAIKNPVWNATGTKISFITSSGENSELNLVNADDMQNTKILTLPNQNIDWVSFAEEKIIISVRDTNQSSQGTIEIIETDGKNRQKITDYEGGIANFAYLNGNLLSYLVAQYPEQLNNSTTGQIYVYDINQNLKTPLQKGVQILGWIGD